MTRFFLQIINRSLTAGWLVLAVLVLRPVFRKAPKWVNVLLWGLVGIRLVCPFSIESALSLIPSTETIRPEIMTEAEPSIESGIPAVNDALNPIIEHNFAPAPGASANPLQIWLPILAAFWCAGAILLLLYAAASYFRLMRKVNTAVLFRDNIYQSENIASPFILGIIKPKIYIPFSLPEQSLEPVLAHEQAHLRRHDHWWKPLGFLLLAVYWFHPLMWLSYILLCRDIELACDEKVIRELGREARADYSQALLNCSTDRRRIAACPLAFGESDIKKRVKSVLHYKRPAFWIVAAALAVCVIVIICFLTNPHAGKEFDSHARRNQASSGAPSDADTNSDNANEPNSSSGSDTNPDSTDAPDVSIPLMLDLNRNGIEETLVQKEIDNGNGQAVEIYENDERIYYMEGSYAHVDWNALFLCTLDEENYLLRYNPTLYQGMFFYSYELFTLEGGHKTITHNQITFDVNFEAPFHSEFNPEEIAAFMEEINSYLAHSTQLLNTDYNLLGTFERTGKLEDDLSTLFHDYESEFSRDDTKSLLENLRLLQETLEASASAPSPAVSSAGLPFDYALEMMFCSGAGGWSTDITLRPDGSFTGIYSDSDMGSYSTDYPNGTQYICRFHGSFKDIAQLSDASFSLTLDELVLDTGHEIGDEWIEDGILYIASAPYGFSDADGSMPKENAQFILYSPEAQGHASGTELYGAREFQLWQPERREYLDSDDTLGCYGLHNLDTGYGFFSLDGWGIE